MASEEKKFTQKVQDTLDASDHISFRRYIFFDSLYKDYPAIAKNFNTYISNGLKKIARNNKDKNEDEIKEYMREYINMLLKWANQEYQQEQRFLETLSKDNIKFPNLYNRKGFDYIEFIKEINLAKQDEEIFRKNVEAHKKNLETIKKAIESYKNENEVLATVENKEGEKIAEVTKKNLRETYVNHYQQAYSQAIEKMVTAFAKKNTALKATFSQKATKYINNIFDVLKTDDDFIKKVSEILSEEDSIEKISLLKNAILDNAMRHVGKNIGTLKNDILKCLREQITVPDAEKINESLSNVLNKNKEKDVKYLVDVIDRAEKSGIGLADMVLSLLPGEKDAFRKAIGQNNSKLSEIFENLEKANQEMIKRTTSINKNKLAKQKEIFSKQLHRIVLNAKNNYQKQAIEEKKPLSDEEIKKLILDDFSVSLTLDTLQDMISRELSIDHLKAADTAEIEAAVQNDINKYGMESFTGGHLIKLKDDLVFTYRLNTNNISDAVMRLSIDNQKLYDKINNKIKHASRTFLERYNTATSGGINVEKAIDTYIDTLEEIYEEENQLLKKIDNRSDRKKIQESLDFINGAVSVKNYDDVGYNNEVGFSAASLGGSGRVADVVENIDKMLEMGGISTIDKDVIISALLNSFDGSVIGTEFEPSIKDYLLAGAAMMLFDEGFANGEKFLEKMKEKLATDKVKTHYKGAVHLLYLQETYIPQSYVLMTVAKHLTEVYNLTVQKLKKINIKNNSNYIELYNPMDYSVYLEALDMYPEKEQQLDRWQYVRGVAEEEVKISFFFMAGMLDIFEGLENAFKNIK